MVSAKALTTAALSLMLALAAGAAGDTVKLAGKPPFRNVALTDFRRGVVVFRGVSGEFLRKPLAQIEWIELVRFPDVGAAERAAVAGEWQTAIAAYEKAASAAAEPWLRDLLRLRLLRAYDRAGRFDRAVALFAELAELNAFVPSEYAPRSPGLPGADVNRRAAAVIDDALNRSRSALAINKLRQMRVELALCDLAGEVPEELQTVPEPGPPQPANDPRSPSPPLESTAAPPKPAYGLFRQGDDAAERGAAAGRKPIAARLRLPRDSFVLNAARHACAAGQPHDAVRMLSRGLALVDPGDRGPWRLELGRCRIVAGEHAEAASDLLNLADTASDPALAAAALYHAGLAHEHLGRPDAATSFYREALGRDELPAELRTEAEARLRRLEAELRP